MAKSSKHSGRLVVVLAALFMLAVLWAAATLGRLTQPLSPGSLARVLVAVPKGASASRIGSILVKSHVLRSREAFLVAIRLDGLRSPLKPGVYELSPAMSPRQILRTIESGRVAMNAVTFPEGFTIVQMADLLARRGMVDREQFLHLCREDGRSVTAPHGFVAPDDNLEGYLFPDTYRFGQHCEPRMIATEMLGEFETRVVRRHPEVADWREPMIVASLVEREARVPEDRPLIAGVIGNRLHKGMRLQIDATVEYALPAHKVRLTYADLQTDSPYNTYRHGGLPPTPICCPGLSCIEAALNPALSDYLFYVAGPGDRHIFTRSLAEHDAVRRKLREARGI
ncbi:MAG: endolytic transglycosylase MltG [Capsulimonadaceae bacterium]|nr:endolytic transglycosylase MltG [Capsulimonadaceae bacterium]